MKKYLWLSGFAVWFALCLAMPVISQAETYSYDVTGRVDHFTLLCLSSYNSFNFRHFRSFYTLAHFKCTMSNMHVLRSATERGNINREKRVVDRRIEEDTTEFKRALLYPRSVLF